MRIRNPLSKFQADQLYNGKIPIVTGQIDGTSPPVPVVAATIYVCTTAGGVYLLNYLYQSDGSSWVELPLTEGLLMIVTDELVGGTVQFTADRIYLWDEDGSVWVEIGSADFDSILTDDVTGQVMVDDVTGNVMVGS
jgi:hypothetical protein